MPLLNTADTLYVGADPVDAVYLGSDLVWSSVPPFAPTDIANLDLWLDASTITGSDGASVSAWTDLSPAAHTISTTNPLGAGTLAAPTLQVAELNGLNVLEFDTTSGMRGHTSTSNQYSAFIVARMLPGTHGRIFTAIYPEGSNHLVGWWQAQEEVFYSGNFLQSTARAATTNWRLLGLTHDAVSSATSYREGVAIETRSDANAAWASTVSLNGYAAAAVDEMSNCQIAEVVIYNRQLDTAELAALNGYLMTKWGLA